MSAISTRRVFIIFAIAFGLVGPARAEVIFEPGTTASASALIVSGCSDSAPPFGAAATSYSENRECSISGGGASGTVRAANNFTVIGGADNVTGFDVDTAVNYTLSRADNSSTIEPVVSTSITARFTVTEPMIFEVTGAAGASATDSLANSSNRRTDASVNIFFRTVGASGGLGASAIGDATLVPQNNNFDQQGKFHRGSMSCSVL